MKQHLLYNRNPLGLLCTLQGAGGPFPHTRLCQSNTHVTHSFRPSASTVTPFPFLLVQNFPRRELGEHFYLTQPTQGQQGWDLSVQRFTPAGIFVFGQLQTKFGCCARRKSFLWLVKSNVVTPPYPRQRSGTQRSRCRISPYATKSSAS